MKTQKELKLVFETKAINIGRIAAHGYYHGGYKANDRRDELRLMVDLWEEITTDEYTDIWTWIDEAYYNGQTIGKKEIKAENRANNRRIAKMNAEAELNVTGFGL